jgi:hypothetical protein
MGRLFEGTKRAEGADASVDALRDLERQIEDYSRLSQYDLKLSAKAETQFAVFVTRLQKSKMNGVYTFSEEYLELLRVFARKAYGDIEKGKPVSRDARIALRQLLEEREWSLLKDGSFDIVTRKLKDVDPLERFQDNILFVRVTGGSILGLADFVTGLSREVIRHRMRDRQFFRMVAGLPDGIKGPWLEATFWAKEDRAAFEALDEKAKNEASSKLLALTREPAGWEGRVDAVRSECREMLRAVQRRKWAGIQAAIDKYDADAFADMVRLDGFRTELQAFFAGAIPEFKFRLRPVVPLGEDGKPKWNAPPALTLIDDLDAIVPIIHLVKKADKYDVVFSASPKPPQPTSGKPNPFGG